MPGAVERHRPKDRLSVSEFSAFCGETSRVMLLGVSSLREVLSEEFKSRGYESVAFPRDIPSS